MEPKQTNQGSCLTKQKLIEELMRNHSAIAQLGTKEFAAVVASDWVADRELGEERKALQMHRETLVQRIREHIAEHGC